jgi:phosphatidylserine/phosphatidylglycerophosphate/cardiolipin synthase-like enzyme
MRCLPAYLVLASVLVGCGGGGDDESSDNAVTEQGSALLEVVALDIWARPLDPARSALSIVRDGVALENTAPPLASVTLDDPGSYVVELSSDEHRSASVELSFDGTSAAAALVATAAGEGPTPGLSVAHRERDGVMVHTVYVGLRHRWFSAQARPPRAGNRVDLHISGETAWKAASDDLRAAQDSILVTTWWWQSDFELVRNAATHASLDATERWRNTALGTLEASSAEKRVLVGQFLDQDGLLSGLTMDDELIAYAEQGGDGFEVMGQHNPTHGTFMFEPASFVFGERVIEGTPEAERPLLDEEQPLTPNVPARQVDLTAWPVSVDIDHASYHQKAIVIDGDVAYVGGMNIKDVDWDSEDHDVFDHRRMPFDATVDERLAVMDGAAEPEYGPRKDYQVRIEGPSAQDVADVFKRRWDHQKRAGVDYAGAASEFEVARDIAPIDGGIEAQVTATLPEPFFEQGIAETWFNAVDNAEHYIFIEDQYFRAPMLFERIRDRMRAVPGLRLLVITKPLSEWTDPGCFWTYQSNAMFSEFGSRYLLLQLRSFAAVETWGIDETESRFADMDVHSKLLMVDDAFMSVGSANKNNRGMIYEGELNVAIADAAFVTRERKRILSNMLPSGSAVGADVSDWFADLKAAAAFNDSVFAAWDAEGGDISLDGAPLPSAYVPRGFLYTLTFDQPDDCLLESVGPDVTSEP